MNESRIMDRNAKINAYYVSTQGKKHKVAEGIPYYLLDRLVAGLTKKYNITMNDIEVRPADQSQYRRSSQPELAEGQSTGPNEVAELLYKVKPEIFSRFGDDYVMDAITQACEQHTGSAQEVAVKVVDILKQGITEDWQKTNKQDKTDGMSPKAVKAYRRENPGSKLKTAVTKKPSELKAGSKDANRRKSFCARMSGNKGPMKDEKGRPTPKAKALSRWNCNEDVNEGWKEKVAGGALALGALGGIGALQNAAPNTTFQGHQLQLANPGTQPQDAKLVTDDNGNKIYAWKTTGQKNRSQWVYRPAEVNEGAPELLKQQMPMVRQIEKELAANGYQKGTEEYTKMFNHALSYYRKFGFNQGVAEGEEDALAYATQAHAGQTRSGGDPYITHPMRVADHIRKYKQSHNLDALISAAYLHDTIEDTDTTQEILHDLFGGLVASLVKELTSDPEEIKKVGKAQYLAHKMAAMSSYGLVIKLADRLDNVKDITTARTPQWRAKYAAETNHILDYIEKTRALSGTHNKLIELIRAKLAEIGKPQQPDEQLDEFAPGNGDDDNSTAEYQVYQCKPDDQFDWIGGPLFQSDSMGKVHGFAYEMWKKHPDKCFMVWQERSQGSRGGYGPKGSVLGPDEDDVTENTDYLDEK